MHHFKRRFVFELFLEVGIVFCPYEVTALTMIQELLKIVSLNRASWKG